MHETVYRFRDIQPLPFPGESIWEYAIGEIGLDTSRGVGVAFVDVTGEAQLHHHDRTHELYFVSHGGGTVFVDGRTYELAEKDLIHIPPGLRHKAVKGNEDFNLLVISIPPFSPADYHRDE